MENIFNNLKILNIDLISRFNYYKKCLLIKIKKIIIFVKLRSNESEFLVNFLVVSKIIYYWFKQKLIIFTFQKEFLKGSRNNLLLIIGINIKKKFFFKFLGYLKNIILNVSKNIDNAVIFKKKNQNLLFSFSNLNYILGLNINKYYKYNLMVNVLLKFNNNNFVDMQYIYEKIFF